MIPTSKPPEMSGALRRNPSVSSSGSVARGTRSSYQSSLDGDMYTSLHAPISEDRQKHSFYIVSGSKKHREHRRRTLERIEIRPALKASQFKILWRGQKPRRRMYASSLDAVLQHAAKGPILDISEANIPLPESDSERSSGDERRPPYPRAVKRKYRSSLDAIIRKGDIVRGSKALPTMVPLPPSRPHSTLEDSKGPEFPTPQAPHEPSHPHFKYPDMIKRGSQVFNHFDKVLGGAPSRNNNIANITSIDFFESSRSVPNEFAIDSSDSHNIRTLGSMGQIPENVKQRLLIVPDLAPQIINLLGNLFGFSPEVFEEHLINSGYNGAKYDDKSAHTWPTAKMNKSYASIKWYRPVLRLDEAPFSNRDLEVLLDPAQGRLKRTPDNDEDVRVCQIQSNIFRSEWEMWTDPKTTTREERLSAWEERATVWSQKLDSRDCYIVILILDPLPVIEVGIERVVKAARVMPHIYGTSADEAALDSEGEVEYLWKLADKLQSQHTSQKPTTQLQKMFNPSRKGTRQDDEVASVLSQSFEMMNVKVLETMSTHPVFRQVIPRAHIEVDLDEAFRSAPTLLELGNQLSKTTSTKDDFCQWLDSMPHPRRDEPHFAFIAPLYHIIQQDTINLLSQLHKTIDEINVGMLSDAKVEDRIVLWRQIIARSQFELPELKRSISTFFTFTQLLDARGGYGMREEFKELSAEIDAMIQRLQIVSSSLTSNMSLLDSRRSIAEAQAVTKLTELAFFFIPLSFAATLFGMQVEQLATPAPISTFIALGIAFIALSYLVRLILRSAWQQELIKAYKESIAVYAQDKRQPLRQGKIPASMFLRWAGHTATHGSSAMVGWIASSYLGKVIIAAGLVSLIVVPLAVIWTQPLAPGIRAAVTVVIVLLLVLVIVYKVMRRILSGATRVDDASSTYGSGSDRI
ncbi:hypothetical protein VE03_00021 [Pseudogymnoascus sp. 23342-1-I1]|nr:hypothetical protein VE03_00021 [Pseudogymnoascus sp. 23342-1-I1]